MGKSHIGLTYSQEINEILDRLAQMVRPTLVQLNLLAFAFELPLQLLLEFTAVWESHH